MDVESFLYKKNIERKQIVNWLKDTNITPKAILEQYRTFFKGYDVDTITLLQQGLFEESSCDVVTLNNIAFLSHCEHDLTRIRGRVDVTYLPTSRIVSIGRIVKLVAAYAQRLQIQERMTKQIASDIQAVLQPKGTAVKITATHECSGTTNEDFHVKTTCILGVFRENEDILKQFLNH